MAEGRELGPGEHWASQGLAVDQAVPPREGRPRARNKREHRVSGHWSFSSGSDGSLASSRFSSATSRSDVIRLAPKP
jgi:hypothetical protein